jgi:hypothetical protein
MNQHSSGLKVAVEHAYQSNHQSIFLFKVAQVTVSQHNHSQSNVQSSMKFSISDIENNHVQAL